MLRAIIFDLDGVICDSEPLHMQAFQSVLAEEGIVISDQEYFDHYLAHDDRGSFDAAWRDAQRSLEPAKLKDLTDRKARYFDEAMKMRLMIYPGVEAFVKKAAEFYALALASGARRLEVEFILKKAKVREYFTAVVSADDVVNGKPLPESFEKALELLNERRLHNSAALREADCLVIEDSPRCIRAAKALGMKTVGVSTSYSKEQLADADLVLDSLVGLELETLEKLFG
jgi:HAD superfamily hydrolase (TIGR01509 family)